MFYQEANQFIKRKKVSLTVAQIKTISAVPVTLLPAPGANRIIRVIYGLIHLKFVTTPYNNVALVLEYTGSGLDIFNPSAGVLSSGVSLSYTVVSLDGGIADTSVVNIPISIKAAAPPGAAGDGTMDIFLRYEIISL